ncbi:MAG: SusD/RagB family nutrient-binding outer membrane lipoprotein, partial [Flavobacteriaceae bacterium]
MKLIKITILLLITALSFTSCDEYLDVNDDVNNPSADQVTPELILPAAQNGSVSAKLGTQNRFGTTMMNQWAGDVTNFTGGNDDEYFYNINNTFYAGIWNNMYLATDKLQAIINLNSNENVNFAAIATILKAHNMQYIVDMYGNAPYSEAFQRGDNYQPAYDNAMDIYKGIVSSLDSAVAMIGNAGIEAKNPGASDVMMGGDMDKWVRFANTLKLKLLVRANSSSDTDMQSFVASQFATLSSASFLAAGENVLSNPGYAADTGRQNPFWNSYFLTNGNATNTYLF